eukprot:Tbor_TRINITY_DN5055_c0_g1::TRINITY_DN5055_c0_g1_i1::g.14095::m.14095
MEHTKPWDESRSACFNSDFGNENVSPCDLGNDLFDDNLLASTSVGKMNRGGVNYPSNDDLDELLVQDIYSGGLARHTALQSRSNDDRAVTPVHVSQYAAEATTGAEEFFAAGGGGVGTTPFKGITRDSTPPMRTISHYDQHSSRTDEKELYDCPITVDHVHWLMKSSNINEDIPITSLKQCSPSFFVLLFQRLLPNQNIKDLEMEPNTQEKRLHNIQRVLQRLLVQDGTDGGYISATEIVNLNEEHISRLIRVFLMLALRKIKLSELHAYTMVTHAPQEKLRNLVYADSAVSTQQLISNWKKEIVPPVRGDLGRLSYGKQVAYHPNNYHPDHDNTSTAKYGSIQSRDHINVSNPVGSAKLKDNQEFDSVKHHKFHIDHLLETPSGKESTPVYKGSHSRHRNFHFGEENAISGDVCERSRRDVSTYPYYRPTTLTFRCPSDKHISIGVTSGRSNGMDNVMSNSGRWESQKRVNDLNKWSAMNTSMKKLRRNDKFPRERQGVIVGITRSRPSSSSRKPTGHRRDVSSFSTGRRQVISSKKFPLETYGMMKCIDNEGRDLKIEQLRTLRFIKDTQMTMRADLVRQASQRNTQIAAETKEIAKRRQRDIRDLQKLVKDEEIRYLQAYECVLMSARNDIEKNKLLVDPRTVQLYRRNQGKENEAMSVLKEYELTQEAMIDRKVNRYRTVLGSWRHGTIAY